MAKSKTRQILAMKALLLAFFIVLTIFFLGPLVWVLSLSFKSVPELFEVPPRLLPDQFSLANYTQVLWQQNIFMYIRNSFLSLGLLNNYWATVLVYIALNIPFAGWTLKGYMDTIPYTIDEAGIIDGCSRLQVLIKLLIPLIMPGIVSVVILIFVRSWAQYIVPYILLNRPNMFPISVGLVNLQSTGDTISTHLLAAGCIIGILPTVLIFVFLQRFIVSALTAGAVKE